MGRCCNGLMLAFRIVQLILSVLALVCAAYVTNEMMSLSDTAGDLKDLLAFAVDTTTAFTDDEDDQKILAFQGVLNEVLGFFQGTPTRAIMLTVVSIWSIIVITYLLVAQAKAAKHPNMNRRSVRITLEMFTLLFWLGGIACAVLLAIEFGPLGIIGGPQSKLLVAGLRKVILKNMEDAGESRRDSASVDNSLSFVDDLLTIGILSILSAGAAIICGFVSFVSCIAACCISGKPTKRQLRKAGNFYDVENNRNYRSSQVPPQLPKKDTVYGVKEIGTPNSWISSPSTPVFHTTTYHVVPTQDRPIADPTYVRYDH